MDAWRYGIYLLVFTFDTSAPTCIILYVDYKEGYILVWANYMSPCNSTAGLYFEGTCDIMSVTMATHKVHKNVH